MSRIERKVFATTPDGRVHVHMTTKLPTHAVALLARYHAGPATWHVTRWCGSCERAEHEAATARVAPHYTIVQTAVLDVSEVGS